MCKCPLSTLQEVDFVISSHSLQLVQVCGSFSDRESSSAVQEEVNQYRRVTVDDNTGSSSEKIGTLVRISQTRSTKPNSGSRFLEPTFSQPQVAEVSTKLEHMRPYWVSLPRIVCSDRVATGIGAEDKCWNGMSRARCSSYVLNTSKTLHIQTSHFILKQY